MVVFMVNSTDPFLGTDPLVSRICGTKIMGAELFFIFLPMVFRKESKKKNFNLPTQFFSQATVNMNIFL